MFENTEEFIRPLLLLLDILIVSYIFYRIFLLLRRTRAIQLLVGFGLILLLDIFSRWLKLETLGWLITNLSSYLVFGIIVLMQPELRRLFSEVGKMPIFRWIQPPSPVPLDDIVEAVKSMASARVGSILIILREIRLQSIVESSVVLDAHISSELLQTIFFKNAPLHDGAVIIEGSKVVAASCYLPMSSSRLLKKTHGARHRAGMGISEESDAIVIVTSEETGKITIMQGGDLRSPVKHMELKPLLRRLLGTERITLAAIAAEERGEVYVDPDREPGAEDATDGREKVGARRGGGDA